MERFLPIIATAAWSIPKPVADRFPKEGSGLERYAAVFKGVEINSTFYRRHRSTTFERWAAAVPDGSSLDPIKALFWSAVVNGFVAVPVMAAMMYVAGRRDQMGRFTVSLPTLIGGWSATAVMAAAAIASLVA